MIRHMRNAFSTVVVAFVALSFTASGQPAPSGNRSPANADQFDQLFQQVKNWGRWGAEDQLGTVNLITDAKRKQAIALARTGLTVSLVHNPLLDKAEDNALPFEHTMNAGFTTDTYRVSYHGYSHSHLDALCHILYKNQTYNGYARDVVNTAKGCTKLGIENLKAGRNHPRRLDRHSTIERRPVSRTGHGDLSGGRRSVGEDGGRQDHNR